MTIENQYRALLELIGWKNHPTLKRWWVNQAGIDVHVTDLPPIDDNLIRQAREKLFTMGRPYSNDFVESLEGCLGQESAETIYRCDVAKLINASIADQSEAILRAAGRWVEEKES